MSPSERGLSSISETGGENKSLEFSPSVMTAGHATSLCEGGNKITTDTQTKTGLLSEARFLLFIRGEKLTMESSVYLAAAAFFWALSALMPCTTRSMARITSNTPMIPRM